MTDNPTWWNDVPTNQLHIAAAAYAYDGGTDTERMDALRRFALNPLTRESIAALRAANPMPYGSDYPAIRRADDKLWTNREVIDDAALAADEVLSDDRHEALLRVHLARNHAAIAMLCDVVGRGYDLTLDGHKVWSLVDTAAEQDFRAFVSLLGADHRWRTA